MNGLSWTDTQIKKLNEAKDAEIVSSRLAHKIIPEFKLSPTDRAVATNRYDYQNGTIAENHVNVPEIIEPFILTNLQTEDEDLAVAAMRLRRAAKQLARQHDDAVFRIAIRDDINANQGAPGFHNIVPVNKPYPNGLVPAVDTAISALEGLGYVGGFVLVAGQGVHAELHTRAQAAADLPIKAIQGLMEGGPVHRSSVLPNDEALVLSISGSEIDRAVAVPPILEFLRIGPPNDQREFRLYERFLTRFKETYSAVLLRLAP